MVNYSPFAMEARNCQVQSELLNHRKRMFSHCVGIQKVSPVFIRSSLCAANRSRATEVYEQCKVCQRTSHVLGYVSPELQFQSWGYQGIWECGSRLSEQSTGIILEKLDYLLSWYYFTNFSLLVEIWEISSQEEVMLRKIVAWLGTFANLLIVSNFRVYLISLVTVTKQFILVIYICCCK